MEDLEALAGALEARGQELVDGLEADRTRRPLVRVDEAAVPRGDRHTLGDVAKDRLDLVACCDELLEPIDVAALGQPAHSPPFLFARPVRCAQVTRTTARMAGGLGIRLA